MTDDPNDPPIYRPAQVAREFGVSDRTLDRWIREGKLKPDAFTLGGHARFRRSTLDRHHERQREENQRPRARTVERQADGNLRDPALTMRPNPFAPRRHISRSEAERKAALTEFRSWRAPWAITQAERRAEEKRQRDEARAAEKAKRAKRQARGEMFILNRFGMTREELRCLLRSEPVSTVARRFRMSDQALRKTCRRYGIKTRPRGYWAKEHVKRRGPKKVD